MNKSGAGIRRILVVEDDPGIILVRLKTCLPAAPLEVVIITP